MLEIGTVSAAQPVLDNTAASSKLARHLPRLLAGGFERRGRADAVFENARGARRDFLVYLQPSHHARRGDRHLQPLSWPSHFTHWPRGRKAGSSRPAHIRLSPCPAGLRGWVRIPLSSFNQPMADAVLTGITVPLSGFRRGPGCGNSGSFLLATNTLMTGDRLVADNRNTAAPLFRDTRIIPGRRPEDAAVPSGGKRQGSGA